MSLPLEKEKAEAQEEVSVTARTAARRRSLIRRTANQLALVGVIQIGAFVLSGAVQEVYLGRFFQSEDPILFMFLSFGITALFFQVFTFRRAKEIWTKARKSWVNVIKVNIFTFISWFAFFLALRDMEPAVVGTICFAIGPVVSTFLWKYIRPETPALDVEKCCALGVLAGVAVLIISAFMGKGSLGTLEQSRLISGTIFALLSAFAILGTTFISKRLNEQGMHASEIMAVRFPVLIVAGSLYLLLQEGGVSLSSPWWSYGMQVLLVTALTIIIPLFLLQKGIEKLEPITVTLLLSTMPIITFFLQLFDSRLIPSIYTFLGISIALAMACLGTLARLNHEE